MRSDVEEEVRALGSSACQKANELRGGFIVCVAHLVAPHSVHRLAGFKREAADFLSGKPRFVFARHVALKELNVFAGEGRQVVVVANQTSRLEAMDEGILLCELPIKRHGVAVVVPHSVKPDGIDLAIACQ